MNTPQERAAGLAAPAPAAPSGPVTMQLAAHRAGRIGSWSCGDGRLYGSEAALALFGVAPGAFRGTVEHFHSLVMPEDLPALQAAMTALTRAMPHFDCEFRILRPGGQIRWLRMWGSLLDDGHGSPGAAGMVMDVTEEQQTLARLAQSLSLTRIATRLARLGAWTLDLPDFRMTWSEENCAIHEVPPGHQPSLAEGLALFPPEHREQVKRLVEACAKDGTPYEFEVPKYTAKGRRIWVRSIGEALRDSTGRIVRLQGAFQDVTARKQAEEDLRQKNALLHIAGRVARIGGWAFELQQQRVAWSDEGLAILEIGPEHPRPRQLLRLVAAADRRRVAAAVAHCARTGTPFDLEARVTTWRGRAIWARVIGEADYDGEGQVRRVQGAVQDVSERVALEERVRQAQRLDSLGQLTGGVAHDFNNLLTVILGNAEMLAERLDGDAELQTQAELVIEAAQRGADLTQRLLAFARRQPLAPRPVDLRQRAEAMDPILRRTLGDHILFGHEHAPALWPALVDPLQLDNTLLNLCVNARDAMPAGGRLCITTANVEREEEQDGGRPDVVAGHYVMLAVSDTGMGIAPEHAGHLFEPFFTTKPKGKGTGLGLAMIYGFVKQSGGHVEVDSSPGLGTTVRIYLPRAVRPALAPPVARPAPAPATAACVVLLVEDDEQVRRGVREQLRALGHEVVEAGDGAQALEILGRGVRVDLLFTDIVMPGMSGRELAARAAACRPGLPVLYTSGYAQDAVVHHGRLDADVELLPKPYRRDELARRIAAVLAARPGGADGGLP